jgi:hypothetical protein
MTTTPLTLFLMATKDLPFATQKLTASSVTLF